MVCAANRADRRISCIYHPEADVQAIQTDRFGGIRVAKGPVGYQLMSGELINGEYFYQAASK